jgi:hypothetical protein
MSLHDEFFRAFTHRLKDTALYEVNPSFANRPWPETRPRLLILRLSSFRDVERSTPHLFLAREVRAALPPAFIDMAFLPSAKDAAVFAENGVPLILGTQSRRSLEDFDLIFISNSYLMELANLPLLLSGSSVPIWASERGERWPPIVLGGSNASAAAAVVKGNGDCMVDAIFFGEGEGKAGRIAAMCGALADQPKSARMARIAEQVSGLWPAGGLSRRIARAVAPIEESGNQGLPFPVLPGEEARTARLAITLGCPSLCAFCYEAHDRTPFREVPLETLLAAGRRMKVSTGAETLELESFNFNTHSRLAELLDGLNRMFLRVNMMSQRVDILARTPGLLELELAADKRSFTLGIEGVSARLRRFLQKNLADEDIRTVLRSLHDRKVREIKLFYILTGRETGEDFDELAGFTKWLKGIRQAAESPTRLVFSFGMLVRMPFTPLRYDGAILEQSAWRPLAGRVKSICETNGFEFRLAADWSDYAASQSLALGGYDAHALLGGQPLEDWIAAHRTDLEAEKPAGYPFAFEFLENEKSRAALYRRFQRAAEGLTGGRAPEGPSGQRPAVPVGAISGLTALMHAKRRLKPVFVRRALPRETSGLGPEWRDAWLMRECFASRPGQAENVLAMRESLVGPWADGLSVPWFGQTVVAVSAWDTGSALGEDSNGEDSLGGFSPGSFRSLDLRLALPAAFFPQAGSRLASFLNGEHVPITLRRTEEGGEYEIGEKALRKKALLAGRFTDTGPETVLELRVGPRFPLVAYLGSFPEPGASRRALLEVVSFGL